MVGALRTGHRDRLDRQDHLQMRLRKLNVTSTTNRGRPDRQDHPAYPMASRMWARLHSQGLLEFSNSLFVINVFLHLHLLFAYA